MIQTVLLYVISFAIFVVLQSLFINGLHDCFRGNKLVDGLSGKVDYDGMVFYMIAPAFIERNKHKKWSKPCYSCIKCMASLWGALTYWPLVIFIFGFHWVEAMVFVYDVFILVFLNWIFYKRS